MSSMDCMIVIGQDDVDVCEWLSIEDRYITLHTEQFTRFFEDDSSINLIFAKISYVCLSHSTYSTYDGCSRHAFLFAYRLNRGVNLITWIESGEDVAA